MALDQNQQQALALCGVLQSCYLVDQIARHGQCDLDAQDAMLETLFVVNPQNTEAVYEKPELLEQGQRCLVAALTGGQANAGETQILRYALAVMHLQQKLSKRNDMLGKLSQRIQHAEHQRLHFGIQHENVIAGLAAAYQETISTFNMRIQVGGHAKHLQVEHNAARIRALLLSAIRSATLWRQLGGHRWHFLLSKRRLISGANSLTPYIRPDNRE